MANKGAAKFSILGWLFSMEGFLLIMGIASLVFGIVNDLQMNIFWGCVIIPGVFLLHKVRKKDWAKHWQEMEEEHKKRLEYEARRKAIAEEQMKGESDEK